jgi:acyl dehydratase
MAIPTTLVGLSAGPVDHEVDERWIMAHAAGLGDHRADYLDTTRPGGIVAHPLFAVCPEWAVILAARDISIDLGLSTSEVRSSVHSGHDVIIHRLVRPGDRLTTRLDTVGLVGKSPGAMSTLRLSTVDAAGEPVATTTQTGFYLGVPLDGDDRPDPEPPARPSGGQPAGDPIDVAVPVDRGAAHVYTECARIWNPIHTDRAVAQAAGLPDLILHGTANLAHGVTAVIDHWAGGRPEAVRRVIGRFAAMVELPSTLTVRVWPAVEQVEPVPGSDRPGLVVPFQVLNGRGQPAVDDGIVVLGSS